MKFTARKLVIGIVLIILILLVVGAYMVLKEKMSVSDVVETVTSTVSPTDRDSDKYWIPIAALVGKDADFARILQVKNNQFYCQDKPLLPQPDMASLQVQYRGPYENGIYLRDETKVWSVSYTCSVIPDADPKTFGIDWHAIPGKKNTQYTAPYVFDAKHVWVETKDSIEVLADADPRSMSAVLNANGMLTGYIKDAAHVWGYDHTLLPGVDAPSFAYIANDELAAGVDSAGNFVKDKNHVYHEVEGFYAGDAKFTFNIIPEADPASFTILRYPENVQVSDHQSAYRKDATHIFYDEEVLVGADAATFELVGSNGVDAKDKNHSYYQGKVVH